MREVSNADAVPEDISRVFQVEFEPVNIDGRKLEILKIINMSEHLNRLIARNAVQQPLRDLPLWAKSWPGALVLGRFLRKFSPAGKNLLELGAGMGLLSLVAAGYGFKYILTTDINKTAVDFIRANIKRNNLQHIISHGLLDIRHDTFKADLKFDIIAASELLYLDELHRPLLKFISRHLTPDGKALFCTDRLRLKPGFIKLAGKSFNVEEGNIGLKANDGERHILNILILSKK